MIVPHITRPHQEIMATLPDPARKPPKPSPAKQKTQTNFISPFISPFSSSHLLQSSHPLPSFSHSPLLLSLLSRLQTSLRFPLISLSSISSSHLSLLFPHSQGNQILRQALHQAAAHRGPHRDRNPVSDHRNRRVDPHYFPCYCRQCGEECPDLL